MGEWPVKTVMGLYKKSCTIVSTKHEIVEFDFKVGVHQGSVLIPLLFVIVF